MSRRQTQIAGAAILAGIWVAAGTVLADVPPASVAAPEMDFLRSILSGSAGSAVIWLFLYKTQGDQKKLLEGQQKTQEDHAKILEAQQRTIEKQGRALIALVRLLTSRPCVHPADQQCEFEDSDLPEDLDIVIPKRRK